MKTIINNLKKYMLVSFVFISAGTMAYGNGGNLLASELDHIEAPSVFFDILAGNLTETALEIEEWMADASYWNYSWMTEASEVEVLIEEWMANPAHWRFSPMHDCAHLNQTAVPEEEISLNDWMKDSRRWTSGS